MRRGTLVLTGLLVVLATLAPPAAAVVDLGVTAIAPDVGEVAKGSNVTIEVTVTDVGGLDVGELAEGNVTLYVGGGSLGRRTIAFNNTSGEMVYPFYWVPTEEGDFTVRAVVDVPTDVDTSNNEASRQYTVKEATGPAAGGMTSMQLIVGTLSLLLFFGVIIASVLGIIPQDRLPVQPALILTTFIIMGLAFIGSTYDDSVGYFNLTQLAATIIIHPITALISGFLVAGALEAAGAFEAAADGLQRLEGITTKSGSPILGIVGVVVILTNVPTIIAMPCGRILAAALMPAALFFGVRVARSFHAPALVSVVVFSFIVNAAASCGPSLIGGIGTIGEGLARLPSGSLSDAQQIGIILATGVCALVMRFVTVSVPPDLAEEEEERLAAERKAAEKEKKVFPEPTKPAGGMPR